jgi:RNA polymerase sigma-70 factor, ECF subfamily
VVVADEVFEAFAAAIPTSPPDVAAVRPQVEAAIEAAVRDGAERWPEVVVDPRALAAAMARSLVGGWDTLEMLSELHAADLYLAQACASGDPRAIAAFERTYTTTIASALSSLRLAGDVGADVAQDVREKLFVGAPGKIATYSGRAALGSWLRTIVTRTAVESLRRRSDSTLDDETMEALPSPEDTPDERYFRATYHSEFKAAFDAAIASLTAQQRDLLRLRFVDGRALDAIGELYGVHKSTAFRWLEEASTLLTKRAHNAFQQRTRATPSEMRSIVRVLETNIELSLQRLLGAGG